MTPDLEQLADEAIELRASDTAGQLIRHRIDGPDSVARFLDLRGQAWDRARPGQAELAGRRIAALAQLAAEGITPDHGCTATAGAVTLEAVRDQPPVAHRYRIVRLSQPGQPNIGVGWLTTHTGALANYAIRLPAVRVYGDTIREALERAVTVLADTERADRVVTR